MFDWPEHSQTSPTSRSEIVWRSPPAVDRQGQGLAGLPRRQDGRPAALGVGGGAGLGLAQRQLDRLAGLGRSPHPDGLAALQDGVVGEDRGQQRRGGGGSGHGRQGGGGQQAKDLRAHGFQP
jgi:hypothetical protein